VSRNLPETAQEYSKTSVITVDVPSGNRAENIPSTSKMPRRFGEIAHGYVIQLKLISYGA
jgi:hypothetical protein